MSKLQDEGSTDLNRYVKVRNNREITSVAATSRSPKLTSFKHKEEEGGTIDNRMSWANEPTAALSSLDNEEDELPPNTFYSDDNNVFQRTFSQETCDSSFDEAYSQD